MKARHLAWSLAALLATAVAQAEAPASKGAEGDKATRAAASARQAWTITDLVLEQDIDPPARQQMLLHGLKALLHQTPGRTMPNLPVRVSAVATPKQFAALLAEVWPPDDNGAEPDGEGREHVLFRGLLGWEEAGAEDHRRGERSYLLPRDLQRHEVLVGNRYVGTGIQIRIHTETYLPQIVIPIAGGPARRAGARPGDLIVAVDGASMKGLPLSKVVKVLQGEEGTKVSLTVRQPDESETRRLEVVRSVVPFSSVHGYRRTGEESWTFRTGPDSAVGYLSLDDIKSSTLGELRKIEPLIQADGVRALVLDLRFTQGLDIHHAALVADGLLDGGLLWRVRDVRGRVREYKADRDCLFRDMPLAALIGEHTGSMAAVVGAALQDRGRAILVGGVPKAALVVTSLVPLPEGGGALLLRTGTVERHPRAGLPLTTPEPWRQAAAMNRLWPEHLVAIERKQIDVVLEWRHLQGSPEPKAGARPPSDPQLDKAITLLGKALRGSEKKGGETNTPPARRTP